MCFEGISVEDDLFLGYQRPELRGPFRPFWKRSPGCLMTVRGELSKQPYRMRHQFGFIPKFFVGLFVLFPRKREASRFVPSKTCLSLFLQGTPIVLASGIHRKTMNPQPCVFQQGKKNNVLQHASREGPTMIPESI